MTVRVKNSVTVAVAIVAEGFGPDDEVVKEEKPFSGRGRREI